MIRLLAGDFTDEVQRSRARMRDLRQILNRTETEPEEQDDERTEEEEPE